jgi:hypothetical protein
MAQGRHVVVPEFCLLLVREIFLLVCMEVLFHLPHDMLGFVMVLNFKVRRRLCHFIGMSAERAEFPLLEPVHVREGPASSRAPDNEVHNYDVMRVIGLYKYRSDFSGRGGHFPG